MSTSSPTFHRSRAWIDSCGVLHVGRSWVALPDIEWRLLELLLANDGMTVRRADLEAAAWPDMAVGAGALNVRIATLRKRIAGLGMTIENVRGRGYVLEVPFTTGDVGETSR